MAGVYCKLVLNCKVLLTLKCVAYPKFTCDYIHSVSMSCESEILREHSLSRLYRLKKIIKRAGSVENVWLHFKPEKQARTSLVYYERIANQISR